MSASNSGEVSVPTDLTVTSDGESEDIILHTQSNRR